MLFCSGLSLFYKEYRIFIESFIYYIWVKKLQEYILEKQVSLKSLLEAEGMLETIEKHNGWVMVNGERIEEMNAVLGPTDKVLVIPELKIGC